MKIRNLSLFLTMITSLEADRVSSAEKDNLPSPFAIIVDIKNIYVEPHMPGSEIENPAITTEYRTIYYQFREIDPNVEGPLMADFSLDRNRDGKEDTLIRAPYRLQQKGDSLRMPQRYLFTAVPKGRLSLQKGGFSV